VAVANIGGVHCRVRCVTYLCGRRLAETNGSARQRREIGRFLARLDVGLRDFHHPAEDHDLLWDLKRADRAREYVKAIANRSHRIRCERVFERFQCEVKPRLTSLRAQVVHNDCNPQNLLMSAGKGEHVSGIIDFGDAVRAPLIQELSVAAAYRFSYQGHPLEAAAQMAVGFDSVEKLESDEIAVLPELIATRLALSAAITSWRAGRHPSNAAYVTRNLKAVCNNLEQLERTSPDERADWLAERIASLERRDT
jgi:Ser/Thr protein kinase RdoA (MazF antagonist)